MAISFNKETKTFYLDGKNTTYAFYINELGCAEHLYYGEKIPHDDLRYTNKDFGTYSFVPSPPGNDVFHGYNSRRSEFTFFGTGDYREPAVLTECANGDRTADLLYVGYDILSEKPAISGMPSLDGGETLVLHLLDKPNNFAVDLLYTIYEDCDVLTRRAVMRNEGKENITLRRAYSFVYSLPGQDYEVLSLFGGWAKERQIQKIPVHHGVISIDSKRCTSSAVLNPFMALCSKNATEDSGKVWGVSLVYSSSFVLKAQGTPDGGTMLTGGIQDMNFSWLLKSAEEFETPEVVLTFSNEGLGGMSRAYHDAFREHLINKRFVKKHRPLLINNWEGTYLNFDTPKLKAIVDAVENTGIDTFVLDDGWFGERADDGSLGAVGALGDWYVNETKLEGGLRAIADHVHSKGMSFGLWFEPEMISENSKLFKEHPDYAIGLPHRPRCFGRHQYMLDLTRKEVCDCVADMITEVIKENDVDYVKWDYNRNMTEFYSFALPAERQSEFTHRYALGLYYLCERLIEGNPTVFFEGCSGGGARFDPAMLRYFPQIWTSDDTDAEERTLIQYGTSLVYPLSSMSCHVSKSPNEQTGRSTSFETRGRVASLGATGYELDTTKLTAEEIEAVKAQTKEYLENEDLIIEGDLYRLDNPFESNFFSFMTVSKDKKKAVLTGYRRLGGVNTEIKRILMRGLDDNTVYYIPELDTSLSGKTLMNVGVIPSYSAGDFSTMRLHLIAK